MLGYLLFNGSGAFIPQAILSFAWGVVTSGLLYVNLAAYHVKALRSDLAGRGSGMFVSSFYLSSAFAEYVMGWLVTRSGWGFAGSVQISLLAVIGGCLAVALRPDQMSVSTRTPTSPQAATLSS